MIIGIGLLCLLSLVAGESLDCSALVGAELQDFTGTGFDVYAKSYAACIVESTSGECIALFEGDGEDHSIVYRIFTFDVVSDQYEEYWRNVPRDVAFAMASDHDFGQHGNISTCTIETGSYILDASGFVGCADAKKHLEDEYDDSHAFNTTVALVLVIYVGIALVVFTVLLSCCICCSKSL